MTRTATRAAHRTANASGAQLPAPPTHTTVAASGGSLTTSREPPGQSAALTGTGHAAMNGKPQGSRKPGTTKAPKFVAVSMAIRIPEVAKWIAARPSFTFAEAAAASAPSPCSPTVMAYTLSDPRLASALAQLGYLITAGGKNGHTVTPLNVPACA